jgi:GT2 family glycosyltransferase
MKDLAIITVPFIKNEELFHYSASAYVSFPTNVYKIAVVNNADYKDSAALINSVNDHVIINDKNCLARAWNRGIKYAIEKGFQYFYLPNLDIIIKEGSLQNLYTFHRKYEKTAGLTAMHATMNWEEYVNGDNDPLEQSRSYELRIGYHGFSSFIIGKNIYETIGDFDERFEPAYMEDVDYLERLKMEGFTPMQTTAALFYHILSRTVLLTEKGDVNENIGRYVDINLKRYHEKWSNR